MEADDRVPTPPIGEVNGPAHLETLREEIGTPYTLSAFLAALMMAQSTLGLLLPDRYRDVEWIRATWLGNDWVTLVVGVPLLVGALLVARRGSGRTSSSPSMSCAWFSPSSR